jgi:hypothetical protein
VILIRLILFILFFYLAYFLIRNLFFRPFKEGYGQGGQRGNYNSRSSQEGDVTIIDKRQKRSSKDAGVGEYIDYEEVKEDPK